METSSVPNPGGFRTDVPLLPINNSLQHQFYERPANFTVKDASAVDKWITEPSKIEFSDQWKRKSWWIKKSKAPSTVAF